MNADPTGPDPELIFAEALEKDDPVDRASLSGSGLCPKPRDPPARRAAARCPRPSRSVSRSTRH